MIKELEALAIIEDSTVVYDFAHNDTYSLPPNESSGCNYAIGRMTVGCLNHDEIDLIRKALTPPTADEVCKAIEEDTELCAVYIPESPDSSKLEFRLKNTFSLICKVFGKRISMYYMLTPRTLSLIGRFYESEAK